jgi:DHA1 family bicyclomycin/chloramphenicol resistance-like MFS transporter
MKTSPTLVRDRMIPPWLILLAALTAIGSLSIDMYLPSFPTIAQDLGVATNRVQLTLASFLVGLAVGQLFYGPFSDRFGRKPPLYFGIGVYLFASLACVFVHDVDTLIVLRFFQGLGGCGGFVISRAAIRDKMGPEGAAHAYSLMMLVFGLAPILAPLFGGFVLTMWGWRAIFVVLTLFALTCMIAMHYVMEESLDPAHVRPLQLGRVCKQYWGLLKDPQFMSYALCGGLVQAGLFAYIAGSPFVLIELYGIPAQYYGLVFGSNAIGLIAASQANARQPDQCGSRVCGRQQSAVITGRSVFVSDQLRHDQPERHGDGLEIPGKAGRHRVCFGWYAAVLTRCFFRRLHEPVAQ